MFPTDFPQTGNQSQLPHRTFGPAVLCIRGTCKPRHLFTVTAKVPGPAKGHLQAHTARMAGQMDNIVRVQTQNVQMWGGASGQLCAQSRVTGQHRDC